ncbi:glycosyltransferase family A protein [Rhodobacteraceae bacterium KMM 6894]|nr:glycosyltransferase family A protein [Rhodobacteraceae bacterium KMM 6894]
MSDLVPFVSVIVPTHNRRDSLVACLKGLLAQDYPSSRYEIHVVHNWSDDDTETAVADIAANASVTIRYTKRNGRGPAPSRHFGAELAKGTFLAFVDDDCVPQPGWLQGGVGEFTGKVGFVQGATYPNPTHKRRLFEKTVHIPQPSPWFETCNIFYRKEAFDAVEGFAGPFGDLFYGEDTDLGRRVLAAGYTAGFAPDAVVYHDITAQPLRRWLMECWHLRHIPLLVNRWPELRDTLFLGVFLSRQSAAFDLGLLGLVAVPFIGAWGLLTFVPFFFVRLFEPGRYRNPVVVALRAAFGLPRSVVTFAALVAGSVRNGAGGVVL